MRLKVQDLEDHGYDHGESVETKVLVAIKLGFISAGAGFDTRFLGKSMSIEEVNLTKLSTVCGTWLSDVSTV